MVEKEKIVKKIISLEEYMLLLVEANFPNDYIFCIKLEIEKLKKQLTD